MRPYVKKDYPLSEIRRLLEPGPVVLVSSAWRGERDIMTMGWHMMLEFTPALVACCISSANHSFALVKGSGECVINLPTADMVDAVAGVGNCSGGEVDKFSAFNLTPVAAARVGAPLIRECYANFECRLHDARMVPRYNLFIWEVVKAHVATVPKHPKTLHYRGEGAFMVAGTSVSRKRRFKQAYL
ncbi:MAG: flavin reductase [Betaproteobacteria bacterium]|nr:flavin reductase [Betaproteobacteria bacterium]